MEHQELTAYDRLFQSRPPEPTDNRIIIVGITEADIQKAQQYPFSDAVLANLIKKIKAQNPRVIGLDLIRDVPEAPGTKELDRVFKTTPNLIGAGKISSSGSKQDLEAIDFPPTLKRLHEEQIRQGKDARIADITVPLDEDFITRKTFLHPVLLENRPDLAAIPGLGALAARKYLAVQGIAAYPSPT
ncbi:MAG: CHASE2 domain-containing protein, partial [Hydrococcus sp. RM1_1_31]|nr:CHASE2 domain-containing protein [Hydrococcus sp. RM1_1_31]